ncbi:hypothetical protein M0802_015217 [Mischocyttarus mexicanus]|nr:hypothetical protein M0802_015217 [Mischocyttarus mexicanus]
MYIIYQILQCETSVIAGVYGPIEAKPQKMIYDKASIEVVYSPLKGPLKINDRLIELYLKESCEAGIIVNLHPASTISVNVQEVQDNGGLLACTINAACLALINSGISLKFTMAAVSCMIEENTGQVILDPNSDQLQKSQAILTFTFDSINKNLISCQTSGRFTFEEYLECLNKCEQASTHIFEFYRDVVKKYSVTI